MEQKLSKEKIKRVGTVVRVITKPDGTKIVTRGKNIITNVGDIYYSQLTAAETPTHDFKASGAGLRLGTNNTTPTKSDADVTAFLAGAAKAKSSGYPKTDDDAPDNAADAGPNVLTWHYQFAPGEGTGNGIVEGAIVDSRTTPTAALCHFIWTTDDKAAGDTWDIYINHESLGV